MSWRHFDQCFKVEEAFVDDLIITGSQDTAGWRVGMRVAVVLFGFVGFSGRANKMAALLSSSAPCSDSVQLLQRQFNADKGSVCRCVQLLFLAATGTLVRVGATFVDSSVGRRPFWAWAQYQQTRLD